MTYSSGDEETGEEIEERVEGGGQNGGDLMVRCDGDGHHSVVRPVKKRREGDVKEPEEFAGCPFEPQHGVYYKTEVR